MFHKCQKTQQQINPVNHCQQTCHGVMGSQHRLGTMAAAPWQQSIWNKTRLALPRLVLIAVGAKANSTMVESQHHGCMRINIVAARLVAKSANAQRIAPLPWPQCKMAFGAKPLKMQPRTLLHVASQSTVAMGQLAMKPS